MIAVPHPAREETGVLLQTSNYPTNGKTGHRLLIKFIMFEITMVAIFNW